MPLKVLKIVGSQKLMFPVQSSSYMLLTLATYWDQAVACAHATSSPNSQSLRVHITSKYVSRLS